MKPRGKVFPMNVIYWCACFVTLVHSWVWLKNWYRKSTPFSQHCINDASALETNRCEHQKLEYQNSSFRNRIKERQTAGRYFICRIFTSWCPASFRFSLCLIISDHQACSNTTIFQKANKCCNSKHSLYVYAHLLLTWVCSTSVFTIMFLFKEKE